MATSGYEYSTGSFDHLNEYHDRHSQRLSSKNLKEAVLRDMEQEEEEIKRNINNIKCDNSSESPVTMNVQKKDAIYFVERRLAAGVLRENVKISKNVLTNKTKKFKKIDSE